VLVTSHLLVILYGRGDWIGNNFSLKLILLCLMRVNRSPGEFLLLVTVLWTPLKALAQSHKVPGIGRRMRLEIS